MPHCSKCGGQVHETAAFCSRCGAAQGPVAAGSPGPAPTAALESGISENVAALLCYAVLWITGLVFFLLDKRPYVRFHAAQSLVTFGALQILSILVSMTFGARWVFGGSMNWSGFGVAAGMHTLIDLLTLVLWIVGMIKAYQGERFRIPIAADLADEMIKK